jgi:hypothetical protein
MAKITKPQFVALQKKYVTDAAIAAALGVGRQSVTQLRVKFRLKPPQPHVQARNALMIEAYESGETGISIAKKYGLSMSQTYRVLDAALNKPKKKAARSAARSIRKAAKAAAAKTPKKKTAKKKKSK